jgi:O-antigen/teichoic acid export membrane protein
MNARKSLKLLHTLSAFGFTGGIIAYMLLAEYGPAPAPSREFADVRAAIYFTTRWIVTPSMLIVAVSGLLAMAVHHPFQNALWVWLKALSGLLIFEATLASVDGPARRAAKAAADAVNGDITAAALERAVIDHWGALWVLLILAVANVVLGIWRPRFRRKQPAAGNMND